MKPKQIDLTVHSDDRGVFVPIVSAVDIGKFAIGKKIKRIYYVYNHGVGIVRGFHFHKKEWKFFTIVNGAAKFIALNPKTKEKHIFISSSRKPTLVIIPPGYANGWVSLEESTILLCASTSTFEESLKDDKRTDPYEYGDIWKVGAR